MWIGSNTEISCIGGAHTLIESVQPLAVLTNEAVVTELWPSAESDCVTEDGWVIFCEILKFLLSGVDTDTEHEFRADRRSSVA